ncbi:uncharacterized protein LOC119101042 [Pollicipes pollicipes]|uniref:uncharacterized protein LOC119101042 n=1 Tax=Pollicipes pollicipes TaxID=41117 RepID=UPI001884B4F8|nr:uncharacterized protein LOC119101042 [Pollicipes pollicipes]
MTAATGKQEVDGCPRDRFHACFLFWLIAALLVSFVPVSALILCAIHKGLIETAFVAGFNEAAVRYKLDLETKAQLDRLQVGHQCCGAKGFDDWMRISWVNMDDVKPSRTFTKSSYRNPEGELIFPWAPWSCCNASILMVCDTIWEFIPHSSSVRGRRNVRETRGDSMLRQRASRANEEMHFTRHQTDDTLHHARYSSDRTSVRGKKKRRTLPLEALETASVRNAYPAAKKMTFIRAMNRARSRRSPDRGVKTTDKKKLPQAPKRRRKKPPKPAKAYSKAFAKGFRKFNLHGMSLRGQGPIGAAKTDSPFESKLDVLLPKLNLEDAVVKLDGWYRPARMSRQALQEKIFHRQGCGVALSKTVFWVIGMGMTTLLTIWVFQLIMLMMARWLQTSMDLAYNWGNPKMMAPGYIMKKWPCSSGPAPDIEPPDAAFYEEELEQSSEDEEEERGRPRGERRSRGSSSPSWTDDDDGGDDDFSETDDSTGYGEDSSGFGDFASAFGEKHKKKKDKVGKEKKSKGDKEDKKSKKKKKKKKDKEEKKSKKKKKDKGGKKKKKKKKDKKGKKTKKKGKKGKKTKKGKKKKKKGKKRKKAKRKKRSKGSKKKSKKGRKKKGKKRKKK